MRSDPDFVVSCEHASNAVPEALRGLFAEDTEVMNTHRAYDPGALQAAQHMAEILGVAAHAATVSRLVCDCNRSPGHPNLFSDVVHALSVQEKNAILARFYWPYRHAVIDEISNYHAAGRSVVHLSVHSFTPLLNGRTRTADVGLLFDTAREKERRLAHEIQRRLIAHIPGLTVRNNYPYRGTSDGMTSALRRINSETRYLGLEIELNQKLWLEDRPRWMELVEAVSSATVEPK